jgi:vancomycin resistance protein VanJ
MIGGAYAVRLQGSLQSPFAPVTAARPVRGPLEENTGENIPSNIGASPRAVPPRASRDGVSCQAFAQDPVPLTRIQHPLSRFAGGLFRVVIATSLTVLVLLTIAQRAGTVGPWWLELSRYLPYPALLAPAAASLVLSRWLGWRWVLASLAVLGLVATVTMGWVWSSPDPGPARLRLMTYNVKAVRASLRDGGFADLAREIALQHPDVLVMQDARGLLPAQSGIGGPPGSLFGFPEVQAAGQYVIASRLPLRACGSGRSGDVGYLQCMVDVGGVALQLVTVHFESPRTGLNAARREGLEGADEWRRNYDERLSQSRMLAAELQGASRPLIVAGDLNAPEASSVVRTLLSLGLRDAYSAGGRGYGYSYGQALRLGFSFLRIDHILVSPEVGVVDCEVGHGGPSEHRPVIADLVVRRP